jgi:hypothetical protein
MATENVNVKMAFVATTPDGKEFFSSVHEWPGVPYGGFVVMQKIAIGALAEMTKLGELQAMAYGGKHALAIQANKGGGGSGGGDKK